MNIDVFVTKSILKVKLIKRGERCMKQTNKQIAFCYLVLLFLIECCFVAMHSYHKIIVLFWNNRKQMFVIKV